MKPAACSSENRAASGTVVLEELGPQHLKTGHPILYTSADSVFQIAAHKDVIPLEELYRICRIARKHCDAYRIGRVIARPFEGEPGNFRRTYERHDFAIPPHSPTLLDHAKAAGMPVVAIGRSMIVRGPRGETALHTEGERTGFARPSIMREDGARVTSPISWTSH